MTRILHLAGADDMDRLEPMVAAHHAEAGVATDRASRRDAIAPLLDGSPHGAAWFIGPRMSPVGYVVLSFGWSVALGGMDGTVDELWIREKVRGRGMGSEALTSLMAAMKEAGLKALHLESPVKPGSSDRLYRRIGFQRRSDSVTAWTTGL